MNQKPVVHQPVISRRHFLGQSAFALASISTFPFYPVTGTSKSKRFLRVVAYNVYACTGWPRDNGRAQKATIARQIPARLAQELALYAPDIITFSESPDESVIKKIAGQLDTAYAYFPSAGNWPGALLTRFEIVDARNVPIVGGNRREDLFTRHWGKAVVRLPHDELLTVHSCHLYPHDTPEARKIREQEISEIQEAAQKDIRAEKSLLVMGDLNHTPEMPEYKIWTDAGWVDTFAEVGKGEGLTIRADEPTRRIDYVLACGPIARQVIRSRPLFEGAFRTNPADPKSVALSDHLPQMAVFEMGGGT